MKLAALLSVSLSAASGCTSGVWEVGGIPSNWVNGIEGKFAPVSGSTNAGAQVYKMLDSVADMYMYRAVDGSSQLWMIGSSIGSITQGYMLAISSATTPDAVPAGTWDVLDQSVAPHGVVQNLASAYVKCSASSATPPPTPKPTLPTSGTVGLLNRFYHVDDDQNGAWMKGIDEGLYSTPAKCKLNGGYAWYCQIADGGNTVQSGCGCTASQIAAGTTNSNEGCGGKDVFSRRLAKTQSQSQSQESHRKLTVPKTCSKDLVGGGAPFGLPIPQSGTKGNLGDGINALYSWNYTCPAGQTPFHNATIDGVLKGDFSEIAKDWQVECTSYQIAFQCCTSTCECHDPVAGGSSGATTAIAQGSASTSSSSSSSVVAISASAAAVAVVGGVALMAMKRTSGADEGQKELEMALSTDDYQSL